MGHVKGTAKDALGILQINNIMVSRGLEMIWQILDEAHAKLKGDKIDEADEKQGPAAWSFYLSMDSSCQEIVAAW